MSASEKAQTGLKHIKIKEIKKMKNYLAIDIGASSGRHMLGKVENGKITLEEVYRFTNGQTRRRGHDCWDIEALVASVKAGIDEAMKRAEIESIGIDTWGVDFVLLDKSGKIIGDAVAYRDTRTQGAAEEIEKEVLGFGELYKRCGIQKTSFNTIYQLWALKKEHPEELEAAEHFLMVPEYLNYALTGNIVHEYTDSSTTSLLDAAKKDWDSELIGMLGLPQKIFGELKMPGETVGFYKGVKVILPAMHDTGSAYLAVPARDDKAVYLSSGTWSLLGVENTEPLTGEESLKANFTNEGGAWGRYRFLKNIMGSWIIQSIRRELNGVSYVEGKSGEATSAALAKLSDYEKGKEYSFAELSAIARTSGWTAGVNVNDQRFMNPPSMIGEIMAATGETAGSSPSTIADLMQCVYISLSNCYANAIKELENVTGKTYTSINIVGGGCQDTYLNEMTAKATGLEVVTGPIEGTAIGNLIVQMITGGDFEDLASARSAIVR